MAEAQSPLESNEAKAEPWWAPDYEGWKKRFPIYVAVNELVHKERLKPWTEDDVKEFIATDPIYGPQLEKLKAAGDISLGSAAAIGLVSAVGLARVGGSAGIGVLGLGLGGIVGYLVGGEVATWTHSLYKFDNLKPNIEFLEWWRRKSA